MYNKIYKINNMDIQAKRLDIYNLVVRYKDDKINNTILYYIRSNNVSFTENNNGFFINLTLLEDEHINKIYNLIKILENEEMNDVIYDYTDDILEEKNDTNKYDSIVLSDKEKALIEYTKGI